MSVVAKMVHSVSLQPEWRRIEVLARCLLDARAEREPADALMEQLRDLQTQVEFLRQEGRAWSIVATEGIPEIGLDLLAAIYAPLVNPDVALLYQDLQQNSVHPSLAFLHRLLALDTAGYHLARQLVSAQGDLLLRGLIVAEGEGPMLQLKPHPRVTPLVSGIPQQRLVLPGAVRIEAKVGWDELIIPAAQRRMLNEFLLWIRYGEKIVDEWGGRPSGGPIALFTGPSGTGKTFSASVVATELGWPLYRVDLGALISKYIGETEKNLNALFDAVHGQKVLLQFDEVDALMGKRGEIKDARDRYANMEVSHLLSRIEQHQGPCILTTNLKKQIDHAFQRRFHFVITFPRPEVAERVALWKCLIPPKAPISENIDLQMIARSAVLTGGEIRNAATHAAILAASESMPIGLEHIAVGVWRVLQKSDGHTRSNQLRQLADFLPPEFLLGEAQ